jgi:CheY-like chemotaxis protein
MKILIAEDENDIALLYKKTLERRHHEVTITNNGEDCLKIYHEEYQRFMFGTYVIRHILPFDAVILDHKMPKINGMEVAEEILAVNAHQRIIFASAYVKETLMDAIKKLKQVVELMQKPFSVNMLVDVVEDREIYSELQKLNVDLDIIRAIKPSHEQIKDLMERLSKIHKHRTF